MNKKSLLEIIPKETEIPKSYQRYLACPVHSKRGKEIIVETRRGAFVVFEIDGKTLKKMKKTVTIDFYKDLKQEKTETLASSSHERKETSESSHAGEQETAESERPENSEELPQPESLAPSIHFVEDAPEEKSSPEEPSQESQPPDLFIAEETEEELAEEKVPKPLPSQKKEEETRDHTILPPYAGRLFEQVESLEEKVSRWEKKREDLELDSQRMGEVIKQLFHLESRVESLEMALEDRAESFKKAESDLKKIGEDLAKENQKMTERIEGTLQAVDGRIEKEKAFWLNRIGLVEDITQGFLNEQKRVGEKVSKLEEKIAQYLQNDRIALTNRIEMLEQKVEKLLRDLPVEKKKKVVREKGAGRNIGKSCLDFILGILGVLFLLGYGLVLALGRGVKRLGEAIYRKLGYRGVVPLALALALGLMIYILKPWDHIKVVQDTPPESAGRHEEVESSRKGFEPSDPSSRFASWEERMRHREMGRRDPSKLPEISMCLKDSESDDLNARKQAAEKLGEIGTPPAAKRLVEMLADHDKLVKWTAIRSLGNVRDYKPAVTALYDLAKNFQEASENRKEAVIALGSIGTAKEAGGMIDILKDNRNDEELRSEAARAVGRIGGGDVSPSLIPFLDDPSDLVRQDVAGALGMFGYPAAAEKLLHLLKNDPERKVREICAESLGRIRMKASLVVPEMIELLQDQKMDSRLRQKIKESLKSLSSGNISEELRAKAIKCVKE